MIDTEAQKKAISDFISLLQNTTHQTGRYWYKNESAIDILKDIAKNTSDTEVQKLAIEALECICLNAYWVEITINSMNAINDIVQNTSDTEVQAKAKKAIEYIAKMISNENVQIKAEEVIGYINSVTSFVQT